MKNEIEIQMRFCGFLMERLEKEFKEYPDYRNGKTMYTRIQEDIKRIRRELLTLEKMVDPWREK